MINESLVSTLKQRQLIIEVNPLSEKELKKLGKDEVLLYEQTNFRNTLNSLLQEIIPAVWKFTSGTIQVMTPEEIHALKKENRKEDRFAVMTFRTLNPDIFKDMKGPLDTNYPEARHMLQSWHSNYLAVYLIEEYDAEPDVADAVYAVNLASMYPGKADLVFGLRQMQEMFKRRTDGKRFERGEIMEIIEQNASNLPHKTLLLAQEDINPEKLTPEELSKVYPYSAKIVPYSEIEKAILNADPSFAYVSLLPVETSGSAPTNRVQMVIDAATGLPMGFSAPSFSMKGAGYNDFIDPDSIRDYLKFVEAR